MLTIKRLHHRIFTFLLTLLLLSGVVNEAWAIKAYYHILTLPINTAEGYNTYHLNNDFNGYRLEALRVMVDGAQNVELPAAYKSPLAKNFRYYYDGANVTNEDAVAMYTFSTKNKSRRYQIVNVADSVREKQAITSTKDVHIYVTYEYDASKGVKLDGTQNYNIPISGGFLAFNRGRNNRLAVISESSNIVTAEDLVSEDFVKLTDKDKIPETNISTWWSGNLNDKSEVAGQFHFLFKFEGSDPYNILIGTAYNKDSTYIESHAGEPIVYKWYKGAHLFRPTGDGNYFMASDDHKQYTKTATKVAGKYPKPNPVDATYDAAKTGYFHNKGGDLTYNTFAILNNTSESGYVFMVSRFINDKGDLANPADYRSASYNFLIRDDNYNNLTYASKTLAQASASYSTDKKIYPIRDVNFKVKTPFYALADEEDKADHIVTAAAKLSQYTIDNDDIDASFIPDELRRKYCTFTTFRNSAGTIITKYADAYNAGTGEYDVYVDYSVDALPFKAITPKSTYTADDFTGASWYELTDDGSTEANGKKLQVYQDGGYYKFKNNGASGTYEKTSEYAFIGDPYELQVISRSQTSGATPSYVGAATTSAGTAFTANTSASAGYVWEMPQDATAGSFKLRVFSTNNSGTGYWSWDTGNASVAVTYGTNKTVEGKLTSNAQNITLNVSNLETTYGNHLIVEATSGTTTQVGTITVGDILSNGTATITVAIAANSSTDKTFTLTITEKNEGGSTVGTATTVTITQGTTPYAGGTVQYNTTATRVKVLPLPTRTYTYKIVDKSGRIAAEASIDQIIYMPLSPSVSQTLESSLPAIIVSPFLVGETLTFYNSYTERNGDSKRSRLDFHNPSEQEVITETPNTDHDIFVTYTTEHLNEKSFKLSEDQEFKVVLNGQYIYFDGNDNTIKSTGDATINTRAFYWKLRNRDPYAMLIDNMGAREDEDFNVAGQTESVTVYNDDGSYTTELRQIGAWVKLDAALGNEVALAFDTDRTHAQQFIAKSSIQRGIYEVMVAAGEGIDASTIYYNIGRTSTADIKIYDTTYPHGNNVLKFHLEQSIDYKYHLIDMAKHDLLTWSSLNAELVLPAEYQSPLVAQYHYYDIDQFTVDDGVYTLKNNPTVLTSIESLNATFTYDSGDYATSWTSLTAADESDVVAQAKKLTSKGDFYYRVGASESYTYYKVTVTKPFYQDIYVTYEVNDRVKFNDESSPYMLRFLHPNAEKYYLEDGNDKLTTEKFEAVYPYTNGDGNLNIYGEAMNKEQMDGGANTRPRWVWFFKSELSDPYHVIIHSKSTISYNGISHRTYLQTYAVKFNQDGDAAPKNIVTGGALPTISSEDPTEYMILGTDGQFRLKTTNLIEGARHDVTSLEQYWKTYNMIKLHVLGIDPKNNPDYKDAFSNDDKTWVVPEELRDDLAAALNSKTIGGNNWHSYSAYANAVRWNGYNDKTDGHEKKVVERLEHWYQTFDMGDGSFDIESADIPPVLILLDRHGWEIMRKPLPKTYPDGETELNALRAYDSPMVKEYKFYSNATKATGCHKYTLRMQNGAERDQIKAGGKHYTSTSLGSLPPITATGVESNGVLNDQYVTYTVKEEYEDSYTYNFVDHGSSSFTESGIASKFLMVQNGRFYKNENDNADNRKSYISKPIFEHTYPEGGNVYDLIVAPHANNNIDIVEEGKISNKCLWYVMPNLDIDKEMGIKWGTSDDVSAAEPLSEYGTKKKYKDITGFDPYNIQLKNVGTGKFITSHMTSTKLSEGAMVGVYDSGVDSKTTRITLEDEDTSYPDPLVSTGSEGYDHTNIAMTNQTFMAVSDANGNLQLMPRFDHDKRVNVPTSAPSSDPWPTTLETSVDYNGEAKVDDNSKMGPQTTFFVRPQRFVYRIIDNDGYEALRYKRAGDYYPTITEHFMSPLATDFKFYYDHAAYTASVSSEAAYTAAATSTAFQKTATDDANMASQAKALEVLEDYYFKIGAEAPFTYKKVTITKIHSGSTDATYTTTNCTEDDWTNATVNQESEVASLAAFENAVDNLADKGNYYYKIGPFVKDAKSTYIYKKVVVKSGKSNFLADVHDKKDISDKEITGRALAEFDFDGDECEVFVRYSYNEGADQDGDKILQGKWFTVQLANKDLQSSGTIVTADNPETEGTDETGTGVSLYAGAESRSGTAKDDTEYATKRASLPQIGDYYFRVGTGAPYKYNKVEVTAVSPLTYTETLNGDYATEWSNSKPLAPNSDDYARKWQWKFLMAPIDPSSELHETPDPYAIKLFNRNANYAADPTAQPSPMATPIKVNGKDRFSLLSHPSGGYALAVNGLGSTDSYDFLNGAGMDTDDAATTATEVNYQRTIGNYESFDAATYFLAEPDGVYHIKIYDGNKNASYKKFTVTEHLPSSAGGEASTEEEWNNAYHFTIKSSALSPGTQLVLNNDVTHNYTYKVINNGGADYVINNPGYLAVEATQDDAAALSNNYVPYLPEAAQTPLLNADEDYLYYGSAGLSEGKYTVVTDTKLFTLYGLYDDQVFVRYKKYDMNKTEYKVPNKRNAKESTTVARDPDSHDVAMNINGELPYNIIWYNNNMMSTSSDESLLISDGGKQDLSGDKKYVWYFEGNDPYALKIKHKLTDNYVNGTTTLTNEAGAKQFMLLKKSGYDYGILQVTGTTGGDAGKKLTGYGEQLTSTDPEDANYEPKKFIIFGLSVHDLIYRLVIAKTCELSKKSTATSDQYVDIPYSNNNPTPHDPDYNPTTGMLRVYGSTQRDLESKNTGGGTHYTGEKYQLGETINWGGTGHTYSHHAGTVSIGDVLEVPSTFYRPNCTFDFYVEGIYSTDGTTSDTDLDTNYKGLKLTNLMSDSKLIDKTVVVNIVYSFDKSLATNSGLDFVRNTEQNLWYTFETQQASEPWLARYTNTQKLSAIAGRATRYTNDYLFTPVGDVYGFKMYNRYVLKNSSDSGDDKTRVMTTTSLGAGQELDIVAPVAGGYEVYELLTGDNDGYFRVHPVVDIDDGNPATPYHPVYVNIADNKLKLSTTPRDWTYGLDIAMLQPYYLGAGNVGGLTTTIKAESGKSKSGKALYEDAVATGKITEIQNVVYDDGNIVDFTEGYYRLHSQPGISGISPVRYASGYLHKTEMTGDGIHTDGPIPMHFYSKSGVNGTFNGDLNPLKSGYTQTNATRGDIPVPSTETDPSTIFYVANGDAITNRTISNVTMSTQGLNVIQNKMGTGTATTYRLIDIGGGVVVLVNTTSGTNYLNFKQTDDIYDLKFSDADASRMDDVKWCMEPASNMGLQVATNNGGDGYYYTTFYAPFDVSLPADNGTKKYNAYTSSTWNTVGLNMDKVPANSPHDAGKFVPAGTPVVIRTNDESGSVKLTLSNTTSPAISTCIFKGKYLEQLLNSDANNDVYTLGLPFTSDMELNKETGDVTAPLPVQATNGVGFYINATPNKEEDDDQASWQRNNRYVLHNKIYYRGTDGGSSRELSMRGIEFVPVIFGDDLEDEEQPGEEEQNPSEGATFQGDGCIYDMMGRKVATRQQVEDGSWRLLRPGIYILNGKKFRH